MANLLYPEEIGNKNIKMPIVTFSAYNYSLPRGDTKQAIRDKEKANNNIQLYLPAGFQEGAGATWGFEDVINLKDGITQELGALAEGAAKAIVGAKITNSVQVAAGAVKAPTDIMMFQKPNPYSISFSYTFVPRNAKEGQAIIDIISTFKRSVLPSYSEGNMFSNLKYPDTWDISFTGIKGPGAAGTGGAQVYQDMALQNVNVTYSGGGNSALVFRDGIPVECSMTLQFQSITYGIKA